MKGPKQSRGSVTGWLLKWAIFLLIAFLLCSTLLVLMFRWLNPPTSAFMVEARVQAMREGDRHYRTDYEWASLEHISPNAALAVVASEDQQFPFHAGFDLHSIREAVRASDRGHRLRGASTISQQVAKNLFLWNGHSFVRKGFEACLTVLIEAIWPKERILEIYLNIAEFGRGIYGVEAAAQRFYHKPAATLTASEAASLAAVLPNPLRMHPDRPSAYVLSRREWIMSQMRDLGGPAYLQAVEKELQPAAHHPSMRAGEPLRAR
ncbi:MAG TPA: monofunctional biosynthetic peptidoglycan transglycosylase [Steroidobacteraceae bacterium]|nr:monofunctional biosynthetic peptidoglycan transglycosylase [Steroidobacteraceae bacterium]